MKSRFRRNILLTMLSLSVVAQLFLLYVIDQLVRDAFIRAAGTGTADLAAISARLINRRLLDAAQSVGRFDLLELASARNVEALAIPQPIVGEGVGEERRYLIEKGSKKVLWTNTADMVDDSKLDQALAKAGNEVVAIIPSEADRAVIFARKLPPLGEVPVGYLVVLLSAEQILSPVISALGREEVSGFLIVDSSGQVLARTGASDVPPEFASTPYKQVVLSGRPYLAASARITLRSSPDSPWFVIVLRDLEDSLAPYRSARDSALALGVLTIGIITLAAYKFAQYFSAPIRTIMEGLELMIEVNPDHRIALATGDELEEIAQYINSIADTASVRRAELEKEVAKATRTIALEKEKLASILFGLAEGVIVCDRDLRVILCNRAARAILTTTWKPARRGKGIYAYLDAARLQPLVDAMGGGHRHTKQGTFTLANGTIVQATAVAVGNDENLNYIFLLRDITQLVNLDRERNRTLNETLQSLRGPLSSLLSFVEILVDYPSLDETKKNHFMVIMREEAERLGRKLDELQTRAEAAAAPIEWTMEQIDLGLLVEQAAQHLRSFADDRLVKLVTVGEEAVIRGDVVSLQQLIRRLFEFGIGFANEGTSVTARWRVTSDGWAELRIEYSGRILSPEETERIFENELYIGAGDRSGFPTAREMVTIREIAKQHGGEVWAKNLEAGATLALIIPTNKSQHSVQSTGPDDTISRQVTALLGDGAFYDFRIAAAERVEPRKNAPLSALSYVVVDLETTGLSPREGDEVISVAGIRIDRGEVVKEDFFYTLVKPGRPIPSNSTRIHGITDDMVENAPLLEDVLPKFVEFVGDSILAGHFISFDLSFLRPKIDSMGLVLNTDLALDTLLLACGLFGEWEAYNLEDIARHLGVKVVARHTALGDAYVTAQILVQLIRVMESRGLGTLGDAIRLQSGDIINRFLGLVGTLNRSN